MKVNILMSMLLIFSLLSCKDDKKTAETDQTAVKTEVATNVIKLTNLTDANWAAGVGIKYDMFLTDYSKEKEELIKNGHSLKFSDGSSIPYVGYDVADKFIQIKVGQKASDFKDVAQFPNAITVE